MSNVKEVTHCFKCKIIQGQVEQDHGRVLVYKCPRCGERWSTIRVHNAKEGGKTKCSN